MLIEMKEIQNIPGCSSALWRQGAAESHRTTRAQDTLMLHKTPEEEEEKKKTTVNRVVPERLIMSELENRK